MSRLEDAAPGVAQVPKALTRPPGALLELLNPPEEDVPILAKDEKELPMPRFPSAAARLEEARLDAREDAKWQRRRELMAKVKEQASSEDENPAAPPPGGSVFTKALKVSEGLYQFSDDQMAGDFPCFDETTATRLRRLQAKDVQRLLRGFEGPQLKQGGLERVVEVRAGSAPRDSRLASALAWEPPPGQGAHILDLPLLHHALGEEGRHEVHGVRQEDGAH